MCYTPFYKNRFELYQFNNVIEEPHIHIHRAEMINYEIINMPLYERLYYIFGSLVSIIIICFITIDPLKNNTF